MNYRHGFHAGNHADVLKHWILTLCLAHLGRKPAPFAALDTHAGRGLYDLAGEEAARSPEWRDGIGRLLDWAAGPAALAPFLGAVRGFGAGVYPGSPALTLALLRPGDRLTACELHPGEADALRRTIGGDRRAHIHQRDGYEALGALVPFPERRGLVLVDPPYEREDDLARATAALKTAIARFGHGVYLWWRPLKDQSAVARADAELAQLGKPWLRADLAVADPASSPRLVASSVLALNPPFGLAQALADAGAALAERLATGPGGGFQMRQGQG